jgi:hypothetical protein
MVREGIVARGKLDNTAIGLVLRQPPDREGCNQVASAGIVKVTD